MPDDDIDIASQPRQEAEQALRRTENAPEEPGHVGPGQSEQAGGLGHTQVETTARCAHLAVVSVRESAVRVSDSIAVDLQV